MDSSSSTEKPARRTRQRSSFCTDFPPHRGCSNLCSLDYPTTITSSRRITRDLGTATGPDPKKFTYTFDHYAEIMKHFTEALALARYTLYMQDYGGPVRFLLAPADPD